MEDVENELKSRTIEGVEIELKSLSDLHSTCSLNLSSVTESKSYFTIQAQITKKEDFDLQT